MGFRSREWVGEDGAGQRSLLGASHEAVPDRHARPPRTAPLTRLFPPTTMLELPFHLLCGPLDEPHTQGSPGSTLSTQHGPRVGLREYTELHR